MNFEYIGNDSNDLISREKDYSGLRKLLFLDQFETLNLAMEGLKNAQWFYKIGDNNV